MHRGLLKSLPGKRGASESAAFVAIVVFPRAVPVAVGTVKTRSEICVNSLAGR